MLSLVPATSEQRWRFITKISWFLFFFPPSDCQISPQWFSQKSAHLHEHWTLRAPSLCPAVLRLTARSDWGLKTGRSVTRSSVDKSRDTEDRAGAEAPLTGCPWAWLGPDHERCRQKEGKKKGEKKSNLLCVGPSRQGRLQHFLGLLEIKPPQPPKDLEIQL